MHPIRILAAFCLAALFGLFSASADAGTNLIKFRVFTFPCPLVAAPVLDSSAYQGFTSFKIWNNSATRVWIGGSDVNTTTKGWPLCTNTALCTEAVFPADSGLANVYCMAVGAPQSVLVVAGVPGP